MTTPKRNRVEKPYNAGTMSNSAFWSMIRSALRQKSRWWKPRLNVKLAARRNYKGTNKRLKYEYQCNVCKKYYPEKRISVDHINPAGQLNSHEDLPNFVKVLFCEEDNLQTLCNICHDKKTKREKSRRDISKKKTAASAIQDGKGPRQKYKNKRGNSKSTSVGDGANDKRKK